MTTTPSPTPDTIPAPEASLTVEELIRRLSDLPLDNLVFITEVAPGVLGLNTARPDAPEWLDALESAFSELQEAE